MNNVELRAIIETLGLGREDLEYIFDVGRATPGRWISGDSPVPPGVAKELTEIIEQTRDLEDQLKAQAPGPIVTYLSNDDFWAAHPDANPLPARWHRQAAGRVHTTTGIPLNTTP